MSPVCSAVRIDADSVFRLVALSAVKPPDVVLAVMAASTSSSAVSAACMPRLAAAEALMLGIATDGTLDAVDEQAPTAAASSRAAAAAPAARARVRSGMAIPRASGSGLAGRGLNAVCCVFIPGTLGVAMTRHRIKGRVGPMQRGGKTGDLEHEPCNAGAIAHKQAEIAEAEGPG